LAANAQWNRMNAPYGGPITCIGSNDSFMYAGTHESKIFKSSNNGKNWKTAFKSNINTKFSIIRSIDKYVFAGTQGQGIYISSDHGQSWLKTTDTRISNSTITGMSIVNQSLFIGTDKGLFISNDKGQTWSEINVNTNNKYILGLTNLGNSLLIYNDDKCLISYDLGLSWTDITPLNFQSFVSIGSDSNRIVLVSFHELYYSADSGKNWIKNNLPEGYFLFHKTFISEHGIFLCNDSGILNSKDTGKTWRLIKKGLENTPVYDLGYNASHAYIASTEGVYLSSKDFENYTFSNGGLQNLSFTYLNESNGLLMAGTLKSGIFRSSDAGKTWSKINVGLVNKKINCIANIDDIYFAGTKGGLFKSIDSGSSWHLYKPLNGHEVNNLLTVTNDIFIAYKSYVKLQVSLNLGWSFDERNNGIEENSIDQIYLLNGSLYVTSGDKIYKSSSMGIAWEYIGRIGVNSRITGMTYYKNTMIAGTEKNGIFVSKDLGLTWASVSSLPDQHKIYSLTRQGQFVFSGSNRYPVEFSGDIGKTWHNISIGMDSSSIQHFIFRKNEVLAAGSEGLWIRTISEMDSLIARTSINSSEVANSTIVFPNPATETIFLKTDAIGILKLYNTFGQVVLNQNIDASTNDAGISLQDISKGIYFIEFTTDEGIFTEKILIE
ncbi:MAG TPA: T9SS type A sorting domain-containing protein, partial [Bacteroidia bacterium]